MKFLDFKNWWFFSYPNRLACPETPSVKASFVQSVSWRKDCVIDVFSTRSLAVRCPQQICHNKNGQDLNNAPANQKKTFLVYFYDLHVLKPVILIYVFLSRFQRPTFQVVRRRSPSSSSWGSWKALPFPTRSWTSPASARRWSSIAPNRAGATWWSLASLVSWLC